ncbi:MAG: hypothetical protein E6Q95_03265, partial [Chitinophagaceae bacterium]
MKNLIIKMKLYPALIVIGFFFVVYFLARIFNENESVSSKISPFSRNIVDTIDLSKVNWKQHKGEKPLYIEIKNNRTDSIYQFYSIPNKISPLAIKKNKNLISFAVLDSQKIYTIENGNENYTTFYPL